MGFSQKAARAGKDIDVSLADTRAGGDLHGGRRGREDCTDRQETAFIRFARRVENSQVWRFQRHLCSVGKEEKARVSKRRGMKMELAVESR